MFKLFLAGVFMLTATSESLTYRSTPDAAPIQSELTYTATVSGPATLTSQLLASNAALSVQQLRTTRTGRRVSAADGTVNRIEILVDAAQVDGHAGDKTFQFRFDQPVAPADLAADPVRQFAWGFSMAPRRYTLGQKGDYRLGDPGQDAQAEAIGLIVDAPVHLPDRPVNVGDQWTREWTGIARKKDGAAFHFQQHATLEAIAAGASPRARITFSTVGTLRDSAGQPVPGEETTLEANGSVLLDVQSGLVVGLNSAGTLSTDIKTAGLKVVFGYTSKYDMP
jgi:hypothetical protein